MDWKLVDGLVDSVIQQQTLNNRVQPGRRPRLTRRAFDCRRRVLMRDSAAKFMRAVQALAGSPSEQRRLFPVGIPIGEELALDFDQAREAFFEEESSMTDVQRNTVDALDSFLEQLSGEWNLQFWMDVDQLSQDPRWNSIRDKAKAVLVAFGWPNEAPTPDPRDRVIYMNSRGVRVK